jgi:protein-arginine kinase activator protein McsA
LHSQIVSASLDVTSQLSILTWCMSKTTYQDVAVCRDKACSNGYTALSSAFSSLLKSSLETNIAFHVGLVFCVG